MVQLLDALPVVEEGVQTRVDVLDGAEEDEDGGTIEDPEEEGGLWSRLHKEKQLQSKLISRPKGCCMILSNENVTKLYLVRC